MKHLRCLGIIFMSNGCFTKRDIISIKSFLLSFSIHRNCIKATNRRQMSKAENVNAKKKTGEKNKNFMQSTLKNFPR